MLDLAALKDWLGLIALLISVGTSVVLFVGSGAKANASKLDKQETKLIDHDRRIQAVEAEMKHMPDKDTVNELKLAMSDLRGNVNTLAESVGSISRTVHRIDDYLRQEGKG
jgi:hypothetical protein